MADIELVIKIHEEDYEFCKRWEPMSPLAKAIVNGTPLPKRHGRILNEKDIRAFLKCEQYDFCTWKNCSECNNRRCITEDNLYKINAAIEADEVKE